MVIFTVGFAVGHRREPGGFIIRQVSLQGILGEGHGPCCGQFLQERQLFPEGGLGAPGLGGRVQKNPSQLFRCYAICIQCGQIDPDNTAANILRQGDIPALGSCPVFFRQPVQAGFFVPDQMATAELALLQ